jgi:hypothetical protein
MQHLDETLETYVWNNWNIWNIRLQHIWKHMKHLKTQHCQWSRHTPWGNCGGAGLPLLPTMRGGWMCSHRWRYGCRCMPPLPRRTRWMRLWGARSQRHGQGMRSGRGVSLAIMYPNVCRSGWFFHSPTIAIGACWPRTIALHYWNRALCLVSTTLGKGWKTLGKPFAECHTRQNYLGKFLNGKGSFVECHFSGTRQTLCLVSISHSANKSRRRMRDGVI